MDDHCELISAGEAACHRLAVVRVIDRFGTAGTGCRTHGARALRAIEGARIVPLPGRDGEAIAVYNAANGGRLSWSTEP
jgi:hypothetical protein